MNTVWPKEEQQKSTGRPPAGPAAGSDPNINPDQQDQRTTDPWPLSPPDESHMLFLTLAKCRAANTASLSALLYTTSKPATQKKNRNDLHLYRRFAPWRRMTVRRQYSNDLNRQPAPFLPSTYAPKVLECLPPASRQSLHQDLPAPTTKTRFPSHASSNSPDCHDPTNQPQDSTNQPLAFAWNCAGTLVVIATLSVIGCYKAHID